MSSAARDAVRLCVLNNLPTSSKAFDFGTETAFYAIERCSAALTAENGESFVTITSASNAGNKYALAHLDFSDVSGNADKSVIEFDTRINGGRWLIAFADLSKRPGASSKSSYDNTGTAFYFGTKDGTNLSINGELVWHPEAINAWIHIKAVIDCKRRRLEYSITLRDNGAVAAAGTIAFSDMGCSVVTGIELYSWTQSVIDVDNVRITASSNINENNLYLVGSGNTYNLYIYHNGTPILIGGNA